MLIYCVFFSSTQRLLKSLATSEARIKKKEKALPCTANLWDTHIPSGHGRKKSARDHT